MKTKWSSVVMYCHYCLSNTHSNTHTQIAAWSEKAITRKKKNKIQKLSLIWLKWEALKTLRTGLTLGLLAVVWGAEGGEEEEEEEEEKEDQGREGNKQPGLVIQGKVHIKLEITDRRTKWVEDETSQTDTATTNPLSCHIPTDLFSFCFPSCPRCSPGPHLFHPRDQKKPKQIPSNNMDTVAGTAAVT